MHFSRKGTIPDNGSERLKFVLLQLKTKLTDYFVKQHNDLAAHLTKDQRSLNGKANGILKRRANDLQYTKLAGTPDVTPRDDEATRKAIAKATGRRTTENTTTQPQEATASLI